MRSAGDAIRTPYQDYLFPAVNTGPQADIYVRPGAVNESVLCSVGDVDVVS